MLIADSQVHVWAPTQPSGRGRGAPIRSARFRWATMNCCARWMPQAWIAW